MSTIIKGVDEHLDIRISDDIRRAAMQLRPREARWIVKMYYTMQDYRIRSANQVRASRESGEPNACINWIFRSIEAIERQIVPLMRAYVRQYRVGQWLLAQYGVGPILSAVILTSFDIRRAPAAGNFWSFAGLTPNNEWHKGEQRPYNAFLKSAMAYKLGEVFVKLSNRDECFYGQIYKRKKQEIAELNEAGAFADYCREALAKKTYRSDTTAYQAYQQGRLPPAQVHARARRFAVKLFISHLHHVMYEDYFGTSPPRPYVIDILGHKDFIPVPNWPHRPDGREYEGKSLRELLDGSDEE